MTNKQNKRCLSVNDEKTVESEKCYKSTIKGFMEKSKRKINKNLECGKGENIKKWEDSIAKTIQMNRMKQNINIMYKRG
jgi:hypothetical protein